MPKDVYVLKLCRDSDRDSRSFRSEHWSWRFLKQGVQAGLEFGMPVGPLALFDEFGIDVALAVGRSLYQAFPNRIVPSELIIRMYNSSIIRRPSTKHCTTASV